MNGEIGDGGGHRSHFAFTDRAAPFIELGTGDTRTDVGNAVWDAAHWNDEDDAYWSGSQPSWHDQTCHGYTIELSAGRQRNTDTFAPATATITLSNSLGWADEMLGGTLLELQPGRAMRVGIAHQTLGRVVLFRGVIDDVNLTFLPELGGDSVEISAVCVLGDVGRSRLAAIAEPGAGDGEAASTRMHRILNAAKFPASHRDVDGTAVTVLATVFGAQVADMFNVLADSVGGAVFGDTNGKLVFRGRDWQYFDSSAPVDAWIGNMSGVDVCPSEWQLSHRRGDVVTHVVLGRDGVDIVPREYHDFTGQTLYGLEPYEATDLICTTTDQLDTLAIRQFHVRGGAVSGQRIERVLIDAATTDDAVDLLTTVSVFDPPSRYRCRLELTRGVVFNEDYLATGVRHSITPESWTCEIDLDRAEPFALGPTGVWNTARWGRNQWAAPGLALDEEAA